MGPHPCGCGGLLIPDLDIESYHLLQWGRIHADAEGLIEKQLILLQIQLQWGRIHADAEGKNVGRDG